MHTETFEYQVGDSVMEAYVAHDGVTEPTPTVLVVHDWSGRRDFATNKAEEIAGLGYVGIAIDMYGKGVFGKDDDTDHNSSLMGPLTSDRSLLRSRINAALEAALALSIVHPNKIAAMGYCFGGMCVLELARSGADVLAVISIHGIFNPGNIANESIKARVLCLHGHDDPMVLPEQVLAFEQEMTEAGVDWQMHTYGGTSHAFTNPAANNPDFGAVFNPIADKRATQSITNFLVEVFA